MPSIPALKSGAFWHIVLKEGDLKVIEGFFDPEESFYGGRKSWGVAHGVIQQRKKGNLPACSFWRAGMNPATTLGYRIKWEMIYEILLNNRGQCSNLRAKRLP
jgi:hypothetical protein